jgi:hypothetical protein
MYFALVERSPGPSNIRSAASSEAVCPLGLVSGSAYRRAGGRCLLPSVLGGSAATERGIRGPVVGRKNHYGSKSRRGTEVASLFYSLLGEIG